MNLTVGFRAEIEAPADKNQKAVLRVAAATIYRAWLNGEFLGCGPARGPHGYFRVDEWDLAGNLKPGKNLVAIEVAGYNCNSYYLLDQPSFCQAEVTAGDRVLAATRRPFLIRKVRPPEITARDHVAAATATDGVPFAAGVLDYRVQKVQRYSFQRPFIEVYALKPGWDRWLRDATVPFGVTAVIDQDRVELRRQLKDVLEEVAKQPSVSTKPREGDEKGPKLPQSPVERDSKKAKDVKDVEADRGDGKKKASDVAELQQEIRKAQTQSDASRKKTEQLQKQLKELDTDIKAIRAQNEQMLRQVEAYRAQIELRRPEPGSSVSRTSVDCAVQQPKRLLPRHVAYPEFALKPPVRLVAVGRVERGEKVDAFWKDRSLVDIGPKLKGYPEKSLEIVPSIDMQRWATVGKAAKDEPWASTRLAEHAFAIADFGANLTGFIGAKVTCSKPSRLALTFDEILTNGDVDFKRLGCVNVVTYYLQPGEYRVESIEPYTLRYLKLICLEGECQIDGLYLREYAHPEPQVARFHAADERLNRLFAAGVLTFRQNALDIFMDCPSRERAGWLCDSFFTSRVAADLAGNAAIERNFFENYLLPERFANLPDGMLPMCYPADHYDGVYIPNWAMWFVVELEEYLARSGDRAIVDALRPKVFKLLEFLKKYENSDGLLEKLPSWVFIEWSKANEFVQDVNYPSNMLYAGTVGAAGRMYGVPELTAKAEKVRETVRKQSFDGNFFVDNAQRREGKLQITRNRSEVCQYFAFFFGVADRKTHAELWRVLQDEFGPQREKTKSHAEVHVANSFIGNMLRMELLSEAGRGQQILDESVAYLLYMAERTGTLWENVGAYASCNHGFASHIVHTLYRDILGLRRVDPVGKRIEIRFQDLKLAACEGTLPTPDGPITLSWSVKQDRLQYHLTHPAAYKVAIENISGKQVQRQP
jgi:alpha-L-rhamnosidase